MEWGAVSPRWQYWSRIKSLTGFVRAKFFSCYTKTIQLIIRDQYRHLVVMAPHCKSDPLAQQVSSVARLETSRQPNTLLQKWSFTDSFKKQNFPNILLKRPNCYSPKNSRKSEIVDDDVKIVTNNKSGQQLQHSSRTHDS